MITNFRSFNKEQINRISNQKIDKLEYNIPCEVLEVNKDNMTVKLQSLVDDRTFYDIPVYYMVGMSFDINRLKYGFLIVSTYFFDTMISNDKIQTFIKSNNFKFGFFIPMMYKSHIDLLKDKKLNDSSFCLFNDDGTNKICLEKDNIIIDNKEKASINMEDGSISVNSKDNKIELTSKQDKIVLEDGVTINSSNPMDISTQIASLKEVIDGLVECINLASLSTGNQGAPCVPNPQLPTKITELQTKINGLLK